MQNQNSSNLHNSQNRSIEKSILEQKNRYEKKNDKKNKSVKNKEKPTITNPFWQNIWPVDVDEVSTFLSYLKSSILKVLLLLLVIIIIIIIIIYDNS